MLDALQDCVTEPQLRAWHSATTEFRASLPELLLERIERERRTQQQGIADERRRQLVADRVAQARSLRALAIIAAGGTYAIGAGDRLWLGTFDIADRIDAHTTQLAGHPE
jgi:hypothetical protein